MLQADMAELADALDLGSSGQPCRFKSCWPHSSSNHIQTPLNLLYYKVNYSLGKWVVSEFCYETHVPD